MIESRTADGDGCGPNTRADLKDQDRTCADNAAGARAEGQDGHTGRGRPGGGGVGGKTEKLSPWAWLG